MQLGFCIFCAFLRLLCFLLTWALCCCGEAVVEIDLAAGIDLSFVNVEPVFVNDAMELREALGRNAPKIQLNASLILLDEVLDISSAAKVVGHKSGTQIKCVNTESAFHIKGESKVVMKRLTINGCNGSAVSLVCLPEDPKCSSITLEDVALLNNGKNGGTLKINGYPADGGHEDGGVPTVKIRRCTFQNNTSTDKGGAIFCEYCLLSVYRTTFENNKASWGGGAIYGIGDLTRFRIRNSIFKRNVVEGHLQTNHDVLTGGEAIESSIYYEFPGPSEVGGAVSVDTVQSLRIWHSRFEKNEAPSGGGVFTRLNALSLKPDNSLVFNIKIKASKFVDNRATGLGGALYVVSSLTSEQLRSWEIEGSRFRSNEARYGGALHLVTPRTTESVIAGCAFRQNRALEAGGAVLLRGTSAGIRGADLTGNSANLGGGVLVTNGAALTMENNDEEQTTLKNNSAVHGGGLMCAGCGALSLDDCHFISNKAEEFGGGLYALDTSFPVQINQAVFRENNATKGGGAAFKAAAHVGFGSRRDGLLSFFEYNNAVAGAGVYSEGTRELENRLNIASCRMEHNQAAAPQSKETDTAQKADVAKRRLLDGDSLQTEFRSAESTATGCGEGGGGAICLVYSAVPEGSLADVQILNVEIRSNTASVGGGVFLDVAAGEWNKQRMLSCPIRNTPSTKPCRLLRFQNVIISENRAEKGAGGLFVSRPEELLIGCSGHDPTALTDASTYWKEKPTSRSDCSPIRNNAVEDGAYGTDIASGAYSLLRMNVNSTLTNHTGGEKLRVPVPCKNQTICYEGIKIAVQDAFDQTITGGIPDADLQLLVISRSTSGNQRYRAEKGIVEVDETVGLDINSTATIVFQSEYGSRLSVNLTLETRECYPGEYSASRSCLACPENHYSFNASEQTCSDCVENAECPGRSAVLPHDGYWHSTPFSPFMRECFVKEACSYEGRKDNLASYHVNGSRLLAEYNDLLSYTSGIWSVAPTYTDYPQCSEGYEDVLCGSCKRNYGREGDGQCARCPRYVGVAIAYTLAWASLTFAVLTFHTALAFSAITARLVEIQRHQPLETVGGATRSASNGAAETSSGVPALVSEEQQSDKRRKEVLQNMTETIKILVNYLQISGSATQINVDWAWRTDSILIGGKAMTSVKAGLAATPPGCLTDAHVLRAYLPVLVSLACWTFVAIFYCGMWLWRRRRRGVFRRAPRLLRAPNIGRNPIIVDPDSDRTLDPRPSLPTALVNSARGGGLLSTPFGIVPMYLLIIAVICVFYTFEDSTEIFMKAVNCVRADGQITEHTYMKFAIASKNVWVEDTSVICHAGSHLWIAVFGYSGLAFYGVIILYILKFAFADESRLNDPSFIALYSFITQSYEGRGISRCWEAVIALRKALVVAALTFSVFWGPGAQALLVMGVLLFALIAQLVVRPFKKLEQENVAAHAGHYLNMVTFGSRLQSIWVRVHNHVSLNGLESASLMLSILLYYCAAMLADEDMSDPLKRSIGLLILFLNAGFFLFVVYRIYGGVHLSLDLFLIEGTSSQKIDTDLAERAGIRALVLKILIWIHFTLTADASEAEILGEVLMNFVAA